MGQRLSELATGAAIDARQGGRLETSSGRVGRTTSTSTSTSSSGGGAGRGGDLPVYRPPDTQLEIELGVAQRPPEGAPARAVVDQFMLVVLEQAVE